MHFNQKSQSVQMSIQNYDKAVEDRGRPICFWTLNNDHHLFPPPPTPEKSTLQKLSNKYFLKFDQNRIKFLI